MQSLLSEKQAAVDSAISRVSYHIPIAMLLPRFWNSAWVGPFLKLWQEMFINQAVSLNSGLAGPEDVPSLKSSSLFSNSESNKHCGLY